MIERLKNWAKTQRAQSSILQLSIVNSAVLLSPIFMNRRLLGVALLLFGSGLTALIYQIAWMRELRLIFGFSTAASAAVLAIFMGGLGLGGWLLGRRADKAG